VFAHAIGGAHGAESGANGHHHAELPRAAGRAAGHDGDKGGTGSKGDPAAAGHAIIARAWTRKILSAAPRMRLYLPKQEQPIGFAHAPSGCVGKVRCLFPKCVRGLSRVLAIEGLRGTVTEPERRFFLALLMNATTRPALLALVAQRFPEEAPVEIVLRWAEELSELSDYGITILDASFPETLEIAREAQPEIFMAALRHFMKGGRKLPPP